MSTPILLDIILDGNNDAEAAEIKRLGKALVWDAVPRVGDLISLPSSLTVVVKVVYWDYPTGGVVLRVR